MNTYQIPSFVAFRPFLCQSHIFVCYLHSSLHVSNMSPIFNSEDILERQHPLMGGKSRRSRRSGTRLGEGGYHMWPGPHSPTHPAHIPGCPTNPAFPTATKASPLPPTWVSSSKFSRRKSHAAVAPSPWCPNWHPETSGIPQNFWASPITMCWNMWCAIPITFQSLISHQTHTKPSKDKDQYTKTKTKTKVHTICFTK